MFENPDVFEILEYFRKLSRFSTFSSDDALSKTRPDPEKILVSTRNFRDLARLYFLRAKKRCNITWRVFDPAYFSQLG